MIYVLSALHAGIVPRLRGLSRTSGSHCFAAASATLVSVGRVVNASDNLLGEGVLRRKHMSVTAATGVTNDKVHDT